MVNSGGTLVLALAGTPSPIIANSISGTGTVTQWYGSLNYPLIYTGDSTDFTGTMHVDGTLQVGNGGAAGTLGSGAIDGSGTLTFYRSGDLTVDGPISGSLQLVEKGPGVLTLPGANTYSRGTTIDDGAVAFAAGGLGSGSIDVYDNGVLQWLQDNTDDISGVLNIHYGANATLDVGQNTVTFDEDFSAPYSSINKTGAGTLVLTYGTTLNGGETWLDGMTITQGRYALAACYS